jgi:hypothetical protein
MTTPWNPEATDQDYLAAAKATHPMTPARPAPPRRPERQLRNAILLMLRAYGIACWPTGVGSFRAYHDGRERFIRMGSKGMSDIVGIMPWTDGGHRPFTGRFLAIECKNPGGRVSPEQTAFLQTVVKAGGIGFVAHSLDEVREKLNLTAGRDGPAGR